MQLTANNKAIIAIIALLLGSSSTAIHAQSIESVRIKGADDILAYKEDDVYIGVHPNKAKVVMIEYGSLSCYHCKHFFLDVIPEIKSRFVDKKGLSLSIIYRNFVGDGPSLMAVTMLRCLKTSPSKSQRILANLYKTQSDWAYAQDANKKLQSIFMAHGYNQSEVIKCSQDGRISRLIIEEQKDVIDKIGLTGTPTIIINGRSLADIRPASVVSQIEIAFEAQEKFNAIKSR